MRIPVSRQISRARYTPSFTLADLEPYRVSATRWVGVPWGIHTFREQSIDYKQVVDIDIPSTTAPSGGYGCILRTHAAGGDYNVPDGAGLDTNAKTPGLQNNIAFIALSARHPFLNATAADTPWDYDVFWAWFERLCVVLNINIDKVNALTQSRGSMSLLAATLNNRIKFQLVWCLNPQASYRTSILGGEFLLTQADIDAAILDTPDDPRQKSAYLEMATCDINKLPWLHCNVDGTFFNQKIDYTTYKNQPTGYLHHPDQVILFRNAYANRGIRDKCVISDEVTGGANTTSDIVPTILGIEKGWSLAESLSIARAKRKSHSLIYVRNPISGLAANADLTGGVPVVGGVVGAVADGSFGVENRSIATPLGTGAGQPTANNKPLLAQLANSNYGLSFDAVNDKMICQKANSGSPGLVTFTSDGVMGTTPVSSTTSQVVFATAGKTMTLAVISATALIKSDRKIYSALAGEISGIDMLPSVTS